MKFSKKFIVTMAVLATMNTPQFSSAESLRKQSNDKFTFTTPAGLTLNMDDLNFVQRHLEEKYPGAPTFTFEDLVAAVAKIEPVSYTDGDDYHINRGKCLFLLQVIDAKLSELKMDDHFSFVELYGPSICGTAMPTSAPTTDEPTIDSPTLAPITDSPSKAPTDEPTHQPTDEPSSPPTIGPSLSPTHQPSSPPSVGPSFSPTRQPTSPPSANPTLTPTSSPFCAPVGSDCTVASDCCLSGLDDGQCCVLKTPGYCWDLDPNNDSSAIYPKAGDINCSAGNNCTITAECSNLGMTDPVCIYRGNTKYCSNSTRPENGGTCIDEDPGFCRRALREGEEPVSEDVPLERRLQIIKSMEPFGAKADATFSFKYDLISKKSCDALVNHMENSLECDINSGVEHPVGADSSYETDPAYDAWVPFEGGVSNQYNKKLYVDQIVDLIGADETMKLIDFFRESFGEDLNIDCMYLVQHGNPSDELFNVPWHKDDYATMEVTLNDDYDGGEVLHMNAAGVHKTEARPGSATAHTSDIVHGITPNTNGAKYMLILKHHFNRPDKEGLVRLSKELVANAVASRA